MTLFRSNHAFNFQFALDFLHLMMDYFVRYPFSFGLTNYSMEPERLISFRLMYFRCIVLFVIRWLKLWVLKISPVICGAFYVA